MAVIIASIDDKTFSLNGITYLRNFQSLVHVNNIRITNSYDSNQILLDNTIYSDVTLNDVVYDSVSLLQTALALVLFNRGTLADKFFNFTQGSAAQTWTIAHNLSKFPSVSVVDSGLTQVEGEVEYTDNNNLTITFSSAFSGSAYIN